MRAASNEAARFFIQDANERALRTSKESNTIRENEERRAVYGILF